MLQMKRIAVKP